MSLYRMMIHSKNVVRISANPFNTLIYT